MLYAMPVVLGAAALTTGSSGWRFDLWTAFGALDGIVVELRLARVLLAALVGAGLATAGVLVQAVLQNDLAEPYILGLSGGASLGAVSSTALLSSVHPGWGAALGATLTALLVAGLDRRGGDVSRLILLGVTLGSLLASITGIILISLPAASSTRSALFWLFGGLGSPSFTALLPLALLWALVTAAGLHWARDLDRLRLGALVALALGVRATPLMWWALAGCVALTAGCVAASGTIGFVGLVAPHAARRVVGVHHRALLPTAAALGASLVIVADALARTVVAPRELPVGLICALVGAPWFIALLLRGSR